MKRIFTLAAAAFLLAVPQMAKAQIAEDFESDFRGRISAEVDYKIVSGLHLSVSEEARFDNNFKSFDRLMTSAYLSYKPIKYLKIGAGYTFMSMLDTDEQGNSWDLRHRAYADVTGMYKVSGWKFSLRERYQMTARTGEFNHFQNPAIEHVLRSRAKVSYEFRNVPLEPYAAFEARLLFNGINTESLARTNAEASAEGYAPKFDQTYFNRYRTQIGLQYTISSHHAFDFYVLGDCWNQTSVDTNAAGKLKKIQVQEDGKYVTKEAIYTGKGFNTSIGVGYVFSF